MLAFALVTMVLGGALAPVAKLIEIAVDGVIGIVTVEEELGFAFEVAVIMTVPAGLPSGMMLGAVKTVTTPLAV
jgi:hypothetical protein